MSIKRHVKLIALLIVIVMFGYIFQTSVFSYVKLSDIMPNMLIIITCAYGFIYGTNYGMLAGIICGFLVDIGTNQIFGIYLFIFIIIGYLSGMFSKFLYGDGLRLPLLVIAVCDFIYGFGSYVVRFITTKNNDLAFCIHKIIFPEILYTVMLAMVAFPLIKGVNKLVDKQKEPRRVEAN